MAHQYDIIRYSPKLREAIKLQIKGQNINLSSVCRDIGVKRSKAWAYLRGSTSAMTQYNILKLAAKVGITVSLTLEINDLQP